MRRGVRSSRSSRILALGFTAFTVAVVVLDALLYVDTVCRILGEARLEEHGNLVTVEAPGVHMRAVMDGRTVGEGFSRITVPKGATVEPCLLGCLLTLPCSLNTDENH